MGADPGPTAELALNVTSDPLERRPLLGLGHRVELFGELDEERSRRREIGRPADRLAAGDAGPRHAVASVAPDRRAALVVGCRAEPVEVGAVVVGQATGI